ncbi:MAG TPA: glycosyltransferase family 4 protein [Actinomycetota bacterium]|nr:glycosyltransferase family 4 protein [Actinomycetota bacterium]
MDVPRTLVVTNDYPPRVGGIQRTVEAVVRQLPPDRVGVVCPAWDGSPAFDAGAGYRVFRQPERFLWPTPDAGRRVRAAIAEFGAEVVLFGAVYPLATLGPGLERRGTPYVSLAHGFEYWLSIAPGAHLWMRRATGRAARIAVCSEFIARVLRAAVPERVPVSVLYPGADPDAFHPDLPVDDLRERLGLSDRPVVVCVSRFVPRKGQDVLIRALPDIRRRVPDAALLLVGGGSYRPKLEALAAATAPTGSVVFAGEVSEADLPRFYRVGDVFAMPCRTRLGGLEVEGWGNVFIEAAACGLPVVVGDSGGARESLVDGVTGRLVDGRNVGEVADAVSALLEDPDRASAMGAAGRARVERHFSWTRVAHQLARWLNEAAA